MIKRFILLSSLCVALQGSLYAGGFKIALQGQKQTAMASTGVAFAQDAATIYFNPGAMGFVPTQISGGVGFIVPTTQFLETGTQTLTQANPQVFTPFSLYYNQRIGKTKFTAGLGVYTPFGSGVQYPATWVGRYILREISLQAIYIQPSISYKINDKWGVGAGFVYSTGNVMLSKDLPITSVDGSIAHAELNAKANGMGFNAGIYGKLNNDWSIGASYHSKVAMETVGGAAKFTNIPSALATNFPNTGFSTTLPLPSELALGAAYKLNDKFTATADINYTFWQSFDSLGFDYVDNTANLTDDKSPRLYSNAFAIRAGLQYVENAKMTWRAGLAFDQSPVAANYVNPELPDNDKVAATVGFSRKIGKRFSIDASLVYENIFKRETTNTETQLSGTYASRIVVPGIGIAYNLNKKAN